MQKITRTEIGWVIMMLDSECDKLNNEIKEIDGGAAENMMNELRKSKRDNLTDLRNKLELSILSADKRIEIK